MKTYVIVGIGGRAAMYRDVFKKFFPDTAKLLAVCDKNQGRINLFLKDLLKNHSNPEGYIADDFDKMLAVHQPDTVIVCTMDSTHDDYICRSLEAGCNVITEKPMTTDEKKCQRIIDTVKKTGHTVRVTFNYRYSPPRTQIKDLLMSGIIGNILSVEFQWMLDTNHGADYFRRWHRNKNNSGGLLVHKATHHFDLINWWLSDIPESVYCKGDRLFYTEHQARRYGLEKHSDRCLDCPVKERCNYYLDMGSYKEMKELYLDCEKHDGYLRDKCVFSDEIDIKDSMNVVVRYNRGTLLSYSLNAFSPWEGYHVSINGTKGRLEQHCQESSYVSGDGKIQGGFEPEKTWIRAYPHFKTPYEIEVIQGKGGHGGGDEVMLNDIFGKPKNDSRLRAADYIQGAYSILVGIAANKSMENDTAIKINDLVNGLPQPNFPAMPNDEEAIAYVENTTRTCAGEEKAANVPLTLHAPQ